MLRTQYGQRLLPNSFSRGMYKIEHTIGGMIIKPLALAEVHTKLNMGAMTLKLRS